MKTKLPARRGTIALRCHGLTERQLVDAYPVELPGWPEIKASVHRVGHRDNHSGKWVAGKYWRVSEQVSGMSLGGHFANTRKEAVSLAVATLDANADRTGRERVLRTVKLYQAEATQ